MLFRSLGYSERALSAYEDARLIVIPSAGHGYDGADSASVRLEAEAVRRQGIAGTHMRAQESISSKQQFLIGWHCLHQQSLVSQAVLN